MDKKRRKFIGDSLKTASAVGVGSLVLGLYSGQSRALASQAIRPPGALTEDDFLGACVRCGLCVRDCPYDTLKLAQLFDPVAPVGHATTQGISSHISQGVSLAVK